MSRIDVLARGLALRGPERGFAVDRIARAAAGPMTRRRALQVFGGAVVASTRNPRVAQAQGCTACGVPHGEGCVGNDKCGQGALEDEPICCLFPSYFAIVQTPFGGTCAQAGGHGEMPPGGAICCCPAGYSCGDPAVAACMCDGKICGNDCCRPEEVCFEPEYGADERMRRRAKRVRLRSRAAMRGPLLPDGQDVR